MKAFVTTTKHRGVFAAGMDDNQDLSATSMPLRAAPMAIRFGTTKGPRAARSHSTCAEPHRCTCGDCAELDLDHPGEGIQLALPIHPLAHLAHERTLQGTD